MELNYQNQVLLFLVTGEFFYAGPARLLPNLSANKAEYLQHPLPSRLHERTKAAAGVGLGRDWGWEGCRSLYGVVAAINNKAAPCVCWCACVTFRPRKRRHFSFIFHVNTDRFPTTPPPPTPQQPGRHRFPSVLYAPEKGFLWEISTHGFCYTRALRRRHC